MQLAATITFTFNPDSLDLAWHLSREIHKIVILFFMLQKARTLFSTEFSLENHLWSVCLPSFTSSVFSSPYYVSFGRVSRPEWGDSIVFEGGRLAWTGWSPKLVLVNSLLPDANPHLLLLGDPLVVGVAVPGAYVVDLGADVELLVQEVRRGLGVPIPLAAQLKEHVLVVRRHQVNHVALKKRSTWQTWFSCTNFAEVFRMHRND